LRPKPDSILGTSLSGKRAISVLADGFTAAIENLDVVRMPLPLDGIAMCRACGAETQAEEEGIHGS